MLIHRFRVLSAATIVAAFSVSGCSHHIEPKPAPDLEKSAEVNTARSENPNPLPPPDVLTDVLYRLADPTVKGTEKMLLVQDTTPADAATMDRFAAALRDNGFTPLTCTATDISWSDREPGDVIATINMTTSNPGKPGGFTFPMEFHPTAGGWQLARETADMVLAFGNARSDASGAPPPEIPPPAAQPVPPTVEPAPVAPPR